MKKQKGAFLVLAFVLALQTTTQEVLCFTTAPNALPSLIGTTYSHRQSRYFQMDGKTTCVPIMGMGFNLVRFAAYWDEIEKVEGQFDFTMLDWQIQEAREHGIPVVLVVGMKAPRWPEFFIPAWVMKHTKAPYGAELSRKNEFLKKRTLIFIAEVIKRYRNEPMVRYWQVENEPLDRSGDQFWWIEKSFVKEEIMLTRTLDGHRRPILMTVATYPNRFVRFMFRLFSFNHPIPETMALGDIVGINVYHAIGQKYWNFKFYFWIHPEERAKYYSRIRTLAQKHHREIWITELQAEPWEPGAIVYTGKEIPPSGIPADSEKVFKEFQALGFRTIFLWGSEYWQYRKLRYEDSKWWEMVERLLKGRARDAGTEVSSMFSTQGVL